MDDDLYEDDDTAEQELPRRRRRGGAILLGVGLVVVLFGCGVIVNLARGVDRETPTASTSRQARATSEAAVAETSSAPPSPPPAPPPTTTAPIETVEAPAPEHTTKPGCEPSRGPKQLPKSTVKGYLDTAAGTHFWGTATKAAYADILVPKRLLYAIAEQESGWQSDIKACDGGIGIMQIMPTTQTFVNGRFAKNYDCKKPSENVTLGANYLAWLIAYYGDEIAKQHKKTTANYSATNNPELLKPVISAYNWGTDGVSPNMGTFPNQAYVDSVLELMNESNAGLY
ncbi:MAG TPA: lytic transglycosylase domain-containing protein [Dactylosporangium sp.]|jgi:hypothetical protein|nr:lytic transglycosylase domain-containing protein [Dactylosporangium sp.]